MELKTKIEAEQASHDLFINREFDLPVDLLYKAYSEAEYFQDWMSTQVVKWENHPHGSWRIETKNPEGVTVFSANGTFHQMLANQQIIRTFEMENSPFPVQLEFIDFEAISSTRSRLRIQIVFKSIELRNEMLKLPFAQGLNMAHNRLQELMNN